MWMKFFADNCRAQAAFAVITLLILLSGCTAQAPGGTSAPKIPKFDKGLYDAASPAEGGQLYDIWWSEGEAPPGNSNPMIKPSGSTNVKNGDDWRCSTCHGWNYADGEIAGIAPGSLAHMVAERTPKQIFEFILNGVADIKGVKVPHRFYGLLTVDQVYQLTAFLLKADINIGELGGGDVELGKKKYTTFNFVAGGYIGCESSKCHRVLENRNALIKVATEQSSRFIHKVRFGNPANNMPGGPTLIDAKNILAYARTLKTGVAPNPGTPTSTFSEALYNDSTKILGNLVQGGLLYDKWWEATSPPKTTPASKHPLWPSSPESQVPLPPATWRCSQCHGWDYRGADGVYKAGTNYSGIRGIIPSDATAVKFTTVGDVFDFIKTGSNHAFGAVLSDTDIYGLTRFVMSQRELHKANKSPYHFINETDRSTIGTSISNGKILFGNTCGASTCHNPDGKKIDFADGAPGIMEDEFVDTVAQANPWEFMHKVLYGQPGSTMPALVKSATALEGTVSKAADILEHAQNGLVNSVSLTRGGRLFDNWWKEAGKNDPTVLEPTLANPMWATRDANVPNVPTTSPISTTWRCVTCHDWNYRGVGFIRSAGSVISNDNLVNLRARYIDPKQYANEDELAVYLFTWIKTGNKNRHDFGVAQTGIPKPLADADIWDLAYFLIYGIVDTTTYISNLGGISTIDLPASILNGSTIYSGAKHAAVNCASCHGANGVTSPPGSTVKLDILDVAKNEANEFFHKARFGQPGTDMPPMLDVKAIVNFVTANKEARDVLAYTQDLFCQRVPKPAGC